MAVDDLRRKVAKPSSLRITSTCLRILFDLDFDHGAWPGPRQRAEAAEGAAWLGPEGLLSLLETLLGLAIPHASVADRAAVLVPRLFRADRFYGASAKADPWSTARRLLGWRDELWSYGWRGESLGQRRLGELAEVTLGLPHGPPERLEIVAGWLHSRPVAIEEVRLLVPISTLTTAWQRVFVALEQSGTRILVRPLSDVTATGNLLAVRKSDASVLPNDSGLQLLRPHGPREAARLVAAALAVDPQFQETVFIGADGILDEALAEFGLPTLGAVTSYETSSLAALLPMALQLAWGPVDPQIALEWLTLPELPLEQGLAGQLATTLAEWPAVGNPSWREVVDALPTESPARTIIRSLFEPLADRQTQIRVRDLLPRIELIERWAEMQPPSSTMALVLAQARALRGRFALAELSRLSPAKLDAVLASVSGESTTTRRAALAGFVSVGLPGGIGGPARRIVWWNFHETSSIRGDITLRSAERRGLETIGVVLPSLGERVRLVATRARRPLLQARQTLLLVAPRHDQAGNPAHPHPLWDEMIGHLRDGRDQRHLLVDAPQLAHAPPRIDVDSLPRPTHSRTYRTTHALPMRKVDSPSSLSKLIGCSYAYALEYFGQLRPRPSARLVVDPRLHGLLAHKVLETAAEEGVFPGRTPDRVREGAVAILDEYLPTHAALLLLHGYHQELAALRQAIGGTAELLAQVMHADNLEIHAVEQEIHADVHGRSLRGTPDIVLRDAQKRLILLDFKWSGETLRRNELRAGTSLQLAAYAMMLGQAGHFVRSQGYLILQSQRLLVRGEPLSFAERVWPTGLGETWIASERAWDERVTELSAGTLHAAGVAMDEIEPLREDILEHGRLALKPPCRYCKLNLLCGREEGSS